MVSKKTNAEHNDINEPEMTNLYNTANSLAFCPTNIESPFCKDCPLCKVLVSVMQLQFVYQLEPMNIAERNRTSVNLLAQAWSGEHRSGASDDKLAGSSRQSAGAGRGGRARGGRGDAGMLQLSELFHLKYSHSFIE